MDQQFRNVEYCEVAGSLGTIRNIFDEPLVNVELGKVVDGGSNSKI